MPGLEHRTASGACEHLVRSWVELRCRRTGAGTQVQAHRSRRTGAGAQVQVHRGRRTGAGAQVQAHRCRRTGAAAQGQAHGGRRTEAGAQVQVHRCTLSHSAVQCLEGAHSSIQRCRPSRAGHLIRSMLIPDCTACEIASSSMRHMYRHLRGCVLALPCQQRDSFRPYACPCAFLSLWPFPVRLPLCACPRAPGPVRLRQCLPAPGPVRLRLDLCACASVCQIHSPQTLS